MILKNTGDVFEYEGVKYTVGEFVYANKKSDYEGLFGVIKEIRDGEDKDTENDTPDIYCAFENPIIPYDIEAIEKRFSALYGEKKQLGDIAIDEVIMAPEHISVVSKRESKSDGQTIYILREDWATDDDDGVNIEVYATFDEALCNLRLKVRDEYADGIVSLWLNSADDEAAEEGSFVIVESSKNSFEAYVDGFYSSSHYSVSIVEKYLIGGTL